MDMQELEEFKNYDKIYRNMKMEEDKESMIYNSLGEVDKMGDVGSPRILSNQQYSFLDVSSSSSDQEVHDKEIVDSD